MIKAQSCFHGKSILHIIGMVLISIVIAAVMGFFFGFAVMWLWNWLMPAIFGLGTISFWQAWGLVVLSHILFKSHAHHPHHKPSDKWKKHFKQKVHEHKMHNCCHDDKENKVE